jgi:hypothetical protein
MRVLGNFESVDAVDANIRCARSGAWLDGACALGRCGAPEVRMSTKQSQERLVEILKRWQQVENRSSLQCAEIGEKTSNPVIRLVMDVIRRDSAMHHRVQQFIIDSIEKEAVSLTVDDLEKVWSSIEAHIEAERETGELVFEAQKALAGTKNVVQQYLLAYLAVDEAKHDRLLEGLELVKRGMYKSA